MNGILLALTDRGFAFTATVVIAGISIVLGVLLLLIAVFWMFGKIVSSTEKRFRSKRLEKQKEIVDIANIGIPVTSPAKPAPRVENGISDEVVAVITAAVAASEGGKATVKSIKKAGRSGRNAWAQAAVLDNTRPF